MRNGTCSHTTRTAAESREREARAELCAGQQHLSTHEAALASSSTMYNNPSAREWWHAHPSGAHHTHLSHTCLTLVSYLFHTCLIRVSCVSHTCLILVLVSYLSYTCQDATELIRYLSCLILVPSTPCSLAGRDNVVVDKRAQSMAEHLSFVCRLKKNLFGVHVCHSWWHYE